MDAPKRSSAIVWAVAVLVLLPVVYLASLGPVCWLTERVSQQADWSDWWGVYVKPAFWLYHFFPQLSESMKQYIHWWANR